MADSSETPEIRHLLGNRWVGSRRPAFAGFASPLAAQRSGVVFSQGSVLPMVSSTVDAGQDELLCLGRLMKQRIEVSRGYHEWGRGQVCSLILGRRPAVSRRVCQGCHQTLVGRRWRSSRPRLQTSETDPTRLGCAALYKEPCPHTAVTRMIVSYRCMMLFSPSPTMITAAVSLHYGLGSLKLQF